MLDFLPHKKMTEIKKRLEDIPKRPGRTIVPKGLSRLVHSIHSSYEVEKQFDRTKLYTDRHNVSVKEGLIKELEESDNNYSMAELKQAVYRVFDELRRTWTDEQPHRRDCVIKNKKKTSIRSMQNKLYTRRKKFRKGGEKVYWDQINPSYMSEESTYESDGEVVVHKHTPVFRSEGFNKLIKKLDQRHTKGAAARKSSFSPFPRNMCSPSKAKPIADAPSWAIARPHRRGSEACFVSFTEPLHSSTPGAHLAGPSRDVTDQSSSFLQSSSLGSSQLCAPELEDTTDSEFELTS